MLSLKKNRCISFSFWSSLSNIQRISKMLFIFVIWYISVKLIST